jgi:hypothetical protein
VSESWRESKIGENPDRRIVWAIGRTSGGQVSTAWVESGIGISKFLRTRDSRPFKSQTPKEIGTIHIRGHVAKICQWGKVPTRSKSIGV